MKKLLLQAVLQVHLPVVTVLLTRLLLPILFLMWQLLTLSPTPGGFGGGNAPDMSNGNAPHMNGSSDRNKTGGDRQNLMVTLMNPVILLDSPTQLRVLKQKAK